MLSFNFPSVILIKERRLWIREWINRTDQLGAMNSLLKGIALEDPKEYFRTLGMSESCFDFLLMKMQSQIQCSIFQFHVCRLLYLFFFIM